MQDTKMKVKALEKQLRGREAGWERSWRQTNEPTNSSEADPTRPVLADSEEPEQWAMRPVTWMSSHDRAKSRC